MPRGALEAVCRCHIAEAESALAARPRVRALAFTADIAELMHDDMRRPLRLGFSPSP